MSEERYMVGIVGFGVMGNGIVQVVVIVDCWVVVYDNQEFVLEKVW